MLSVFYMFNQSLQNELSFLGTQVLLCPLLDSGFRKCRFPLLLPCSTVPVLAGWRLTYSHYVGNSPAFSANSHCLSLYSLGKYLTVKVTVKVKATPRLTVYRQSVRLGAKPLEDHDQMIFCKMKPCGHSPYVTVSLTRGWVCLLWMYLAFKCTFRTYSMLLQILPFALHTSPLPVEALQNRSCLSYVSYPTTTD
jgi:hypothetical protein